MMHLQIIQHQKYFSICILYQALQKLDHGLGVHRVFIDHEANFALIGYSRYQNVMLSVGGKSDSWGVSTGGIAPTMIARLSNNPKKLILGFFVGCKCVVLLCPK
jgi:hypothetical protein